ncbi:MAG: phenylalanine--tRNA ligase subunit alpha, partial [Candidatus Latescibacterota bacterium]
MELAERIRQVAEEAERALGTCGDLGELEALRVRYLGRKGALTLLLREIGKLPPEERPIAGRAGSEAREKLEGLFRERREVLRKAQTRKEALDVTLPGRRPPLGKRHPLTQIVDEIVDIFRGMGFEVVEGPEIETEYHNFDALNTPPDHPARDLHDTFYVEGGRLLRTHTSPVQIRVMESRRPPLKVIPPGRCYRNDTPDATHSPIFHQV